MTVNEKLIDDATTAFTDREIVPPSKENLRVALDAFEASLARCGCEPCTIARRARVALTDHDRTSLARVLHEIVYSPGANYDRAVPGIQEHMLACADKVAAALPWLVPHTPTNDEREASKPEICERCGWALSGHLRSEYGLDCPPGGSRPGFRRSAVPEPTAPARITIEHEGGNTVTGTPEQVLNHGHLKPGWKYRDSEPQGEPSDATEGDLIAWQCRPGRGSAPVRALIIAPQGRDDACRYRPRSA